MAMKVTGPGGINDPAAARKKKKPGDPGFADALRQTAETDEGTAAAAAGGVGAVDSVFTVQEVGDATDHASRGRGLAFGNDVLDRLDELRLAIVAGAVSKDQLQALAQRLRQKRETTDDPRLDDILSEIELRAEVEIAKLTRPERGAD